MSSWMKPCCCDFRCVQERRLEKETSRQTQMDMDSLKESMEEKREE